MLIFKFHFFRDLKQDKQNLLRRYSSPLDLLKEFIPILFFARGVGNLVLPSLVSSTSTETMIKESLADPKKGLSEREMFPHSMLQ